MILLFDKTMDDLKSKTEAALKRVGFSTMPGSIAKLLLNIINENLADFYETLKVNHVQSFVSTATGSFLEAIGLLVACKRKDLETDDDYRYRISQQILSTATANETAIRLAALSIPDVQDIVLQKYAYGAGSFSLLIITDKITANDTVLANVRRAVDKVVGYGIKFEIANPDIITVKFNIKLLTKDSVSDGSKQELKNQVRSALTKYLLTRAIGEGLIVNEITQRIMEVSNDISDYTCSNFKINNNTAIFINQDCRWNERYMISSDPDAITIN